MRRHLLSRLLTAGVLLWLVLTASFALLHALPGGPGAVVEDPRVPPAQRVRLRAVLGLDRPLPERYARFLAAAARGDWGISFSSQRPVTRVLADAAPHTLALGAAALALEFLLGVPLGVAAARRAGSALDHGVRALSLVLWSIPSFALALALLLVFALEWTWFPAGGPSTPGAAAWPLLPRLGDRLAHLALPALALGLPAAAATARFVRAALLEVAGSPHLVAARARGLHRRTIFLRHALLPAAGPMVELAGLSCAALLSGTLAVELIFARPGLGRAAFDALAARDYPVLLGATALSAAGVLAASFAAELLHAAVDPRRRARFERA